MSVRRCVGKPSYFSHGKFRRPSDMKLYLEKFPLKGFKDRNFVRPRLYVRSCSCHSAWEDLMYICTGDKKFKFRRHKLELKSFSLPSYKRLNRIEPTWPETNRISLNKGISKQEMTWLISTSLSHLVTFSRLIEHFHMAPVAAASNSLFSTLNDKDTRGSRPPNFRTSSRVSLSSAHWKQVKKKKNDDQFSTVLTEYSNCCTSLRMRKWLLHVQETRMSLGFMGLTGFFFYNNTSETSVIVHPDQEAPKQTSVCFWALNTKFNN